MRKVALFSILLVIGLVGSQALPGLLGGAYDTANATLIFFTMVALAFIMIHVGYEFEIDKSDLGGYGWDYVVAFTAATFPWAFAALYFVIVLLPVDTWGTFDAWKETLLAGRFAAPTSAGVLFSMLAAAGLSATWMFRKARVLAIFDDLDTVILMVPLKMLMVGTVWQLGAVVGVMAACLVAGYVWLHRVRLPITWRWVLSYAGAIALVSEVVHEASKAIDEAVTIHIEVLLPAFALGCMLARPAGADPHSDDAREGHQEGPESPEEQRVATIISAIFMVLVGLTLPPILAGAASPETTATITGSQPALGWDAIALHTLALTVLIHLGKMFPAFCYRRKASFRERLAVSIAMWPRGEVGAGVLVISIGYGIGGPVLTIAMLSLALNLLLTGAFIVVVKRLLADVLPSTQAS